MGDTNVTKVRFLALLAATAVLTLAGTTAQAQSSMSFFITSAGPGKGADLGGIAGADRHCQALAQSVGAGQKTWRAYLSTQAAAGAPAINARDRIGAGPWQNAKGVVIAKNVAELHANNSLGKQSALDEKGNVVNASGDTPNTAGFSRQVQHLMFSRNASAGVLYPRHFLGVELTAHVISSISRAV